ncbi:MAG: hypothetical protein KDA85_09110 [Planctomycetaceae bacterium]|nr:hypothetical protein [Planctomycetaceae bacterium]
MNKQRLFFTLTAVVCTIAGVTSDALAGCNCQTTHMTMMAIPQASGMMIAPPAVPAAAFQYTPLESYTPPGTLGTTYTRPSHPIPVDEHPRTGRLAVRDQGAVEHLSVKGMGGFRMKNGIWLFESIRPLDVGVSQVVRVEARRTTDDVEPYATKFVRLIPGRIVYLDF